MATISAFDYVSVAVSTDEGRYNMTAAYREKDRLVGTDGHRLHMVSGLAMQSEGSFVDGRDASFPNYEAVFPKNPKDLASVTFTKKQISHLNKLVKLFNDRNCGTDFTFKDGALILTAKEASTEAHGAWVTTMTFDCVTKGEWSVRLNLRYFVEALIPGVPMVLSAESANGPQVFKADLHGSEYMAIVMPLRAD